MSQPKFHLDPVTPYKHDARVTVPAEMVDIKDADFAALATMQAVDVFDPPPDLGLALNVCALELLEGWPVEACERGSDLVDRNAIPFQAGYERWPQQACSNVAALVARLVRA